MKPKHQLSLQDVQKGMRDHYEGTPFDITKDAGGGIYNMPYRLSPLSFKYEGKEYFNERPISTVQTAFTFVAQLRSNMPNAIGGVMWFGADDSNMIVYTPVYCSTTVVPACYAAENTDPVTFSWNSSFWVFNWVANMVYPKYSLVIDDMRKVQNTLESSIYEQSKSVEAEALAAMENSPRYAKKILNDFTCDAAETALAEWKKFGEFIIVKYNDFVVKPEENGRFKRSSTGIGATVKRPGYPEMYRKQIVEQTGDKYLMPDAK